MRSFSVFRAAVSANNNFCCSMGLVGHVLFKREERGKTFFARLLTWLPAQIFGA